MNSSEDRTEENPIDTAYRAIRQMVVEGRLAPGSRLVERDLAAHLGLSRSPIRSVLLRLQQEGYLVAASNGKRVRLNVAPLTKADASELFSFIGFLDGLAARTAAQADAEVRRTVCETLKRVNAELEVIAGQPPFNAQRFFDVDIEFHGAYVGLLSTSRARVLYESFRPQAERYRIGYINSLADGYGDGIIAEHDAIIRAIHRGDGAAAQRAAEGNWHAASERICGLMSMAGERGVW